MASRMTDRPRNTGTRRHARVLTRFRPVDMLATALWNGDRVRHSWQRRHSPIAGSAASQALPAGSLSSGLRPWVYLRVCSGPPASDGANAITTDAGGRDEAHIY